MALTNKTHFNPCFWTAYWNFDFLNKKRSDNPKKENVRRQKVYVLNLKSKKIYSNVTDKVFVKKKLGQAEITKEAAIDFTKRNHPQELKNIEKYYENNDGQHILDFENFFTFMEDSYRVYLEQLILKPGPINDTEKSHLSFFILFQLIRNPMALDSSTAFFNSVGMEKFELFVTIIHALSNPDNLARLVLPIALPPWTIYKTEKKIFPLSDNPALIRHKHLMIAVAPDIMIELKIDFKAKEMHSGKLKKRISYVKKREFIKRTIQNSFNEIIHGSEEELRKIKSSQAFKVRSKINAP